MSGIFGIFHRDGTPVSRDKIQLMHDAMVNWGPDGSEVWLNGCAGLGQCLLQNKPEDIHERLPRWLPEFNLAFTADARVDNRDELCLTYPKKIKRIPLIVTLFYKHI